MKSTRACLVVLASLAIAAAALAQTPQHVLTNLQDAKWGPAPPMLPPGATVEVLDGNPAQSGLVTLRARMPAGYKIPAHSHPADEHVVVLSGAFSMGMGDKLDESAGRPLSVGGFALMPAGMNHYGYTKDGAVVLIYGQGPLEFKYVNPADDPRNLKK